MIRPPATWPQQPEMVTTPTGRAGPLHCVKVTVPARGRLVAGIRPSLLPSSARPEAIKGPHTHTLWGATW